MHGERRVRKGVDLVRLDAQGLDDIVPGHLE